MFACVLMGTKLGENWGSLPATGHLKMPSGEGNATSFREAGVNLDYTSCMGTQ